MIKVIKRAVSLSKQIVKRSHAFKDAHHEKYKMFKKNVSVISVENRFIYDYWKTIFHDWLFTSFLSYQFNCHGIMFKWNSWTKCLDHIQSFGASCIFLFPIFFQFSYFHFSVTNFNLDDWGTHVEISTHKMDRYRLSKLIIRIVVLGGKMILYVIIIFNRCTYNI